MWAIVGHLYNIGEAEERVVALFSSQTSAENYLDRARLERPIQGYPFESKSLLSHFYEARVEKDWEKIEFIIDPLVNF